MKRTPSLRLSAPRIECGPPWSAKAMGCICFSDWPAPRLISCVYQFILTVSGCEIQPMHAAGVQTLHAPVRSKVVNAALINTCMRGNVESETIVLLPCFSFVLFAATSEARSVRDFDCEQQRSTLITQVRHPHVANCVHSAFVCVNTLASCARPLGCEGVGLSHTTAFQDAASPPLRPSLPLSALRDTSHIFHILCV